MKQVECIGIGAEPWNNVVVVEREPPPVGPGQVRVAVRARPIDPADLLLLEGRHLFRPADLLAHRRAIEAELLELFAAGVLETEIEATYPLEEVAAALQHQLRPGRRGKIVLVS